MLDGGHVFIVKKVQVMCDCSFRWTYFRKAPHNYRIILHTYTVLWTKNRWSLKYHVAMLSAVIDLTFLWVTSPCIPITKYSAIHLRLDNESECICVPQIIQHMRSSENRDPSKCTNSAKSIRKAYTRLYLDVKQVINVEVYCSIYSRKNIINKIAAKLNPHTDSLIINHS